jgi:hypothetical protein
VKKIFCILAVLYHAAMPHALFSLNNTLLQALRAMCEEDQEARLHWVHSHTSGTNEGTQQIDKIDLQHLPLLKDIIHQFGWPGFQLVGKEGADMMWLLIQHCDQDVPFQKLCLQLLEKAIANGDDTKEHFAYLLDRTLVNEGKKQMYGTQIQIVAGRARPYPIQDSHDVDKRREEMRLSPLSEYLILIESTYLLQK